MLHVNKRKLKKTDGPNNYSRELWIGWIETKVMKRMELLDKGRDDFVEEEGWMHVAMAGERV